MSTVLEDYQALYQKARDLSQAIGDSQLAIDTVGEEVGEGTAQRIEALEESLEKIEDYLKKIKEFRFLAEKHLESKNVATIEAPPDYRVNLNRLRNWALMIDPLSSNDPYAQRIYLTAQCDELFLQKKKEEFTRLIEQLKCSDVHGSDQGLDRLKGQITAGEEALSSLAVSPEMLEFAKKIKEANTAHWFEIPPDQYANSPQTAPLAFGAYVLPLGFSKEQNPSLKQLFGKFFDEAGGRVLMPVEIEAGQEFALAVTSSATRARQLDRGLQNLILNIIQNSLAGDHKILILDARRYNSSVLGSLKELEDSFIIERIPRNPEQLSNALEKMVASFADLDDVLDLYNSVSEYNADQEPAKRLPRRTLILFGRPEDFEGRDREYIRRIMTNYERYGISFVSISFKEYRGDGYGGIPEYAWQNAWHISMRPNETSIRLGSGHESRFTWYTLNSDLPESFLASIRAVKIEESAIGSEYPKRYDLANIPPYTRAYKPLELPFGIDAKDQAYSMSFERENFAAYLVGASGSGKSTLLHTLITGIIRNYHPDNLELWLADFKQLEFKKYIAHCPPHVKYILLDESTELVYDLVDRIYDKMMERQRILARLGKERIDQLDPRELNEPMPVILVVLDEFSMMSQVLAESYSHKLRLQNILAKGRALGIRFLLASQTFAKGIVGLTPTAKDQIQQRIAMKSSPEEIRETLELSAGLRTEQVNNWIDALPPYYALVKHRTGIDSPPEVMRVNVMYIPDYSVRDRMIDRINQSMTAGSIYDPNEINSYIDKEPVIVDGNSYEAFDPEAFVRHIDQVRMRYQGSSGEETFVTFGSPRLMEKLKTSILTHETRENLLLIGRSAEQACTAAIMTSVMKSALIQGRKVSVWAYGKNRLYQAYRHSAWADEVFARVNFVEDLDDVCGAILRLKDAIQSRVPSNEVILLIGFDRIYSDFDYLEADQNSPGLARESRQSQFIGDLKASGALAQTEEELSLVEIGQKLSALRSSVGEEARQAGKSEEEIQEAIQKASRAFLDDHAGKEDRRVPQETRTEPEEELVEEVTLPASLTYNAAADFEYIIRQGSRLGYHFMLQLNNYSDLKPMKLRTDYFRHKLAFQLSPEESRDLFGSRLAQNLPEHICQYHDSLEGYSFRPYMHPHITWEGWEIDAEGKAVNPFDS